MPSGVGRPALLGMLVIAAASAGYLAWEVAHSGVYAYATGIYPISDADEWRYTACSRLLLHGYTLFSQIFSAQPPLLFASLAGSMALFGQSIDGARIAEIVYGLLALWSAAWLAWAVRGPVAAAATTVVLALSTTFLVYSHAVEAEVPMMALSTLSLALAASYRRSGRRTLLIISGLSLAAAVLMKLFALETALPLLWILLEERKIDGSAVMDVLTAGMACIVPLALDFVLISPTQQWDQVVSLHSAVASAALPDVESPVDVLRNFFVLDAGLSALAVAGLCAVAVGRRWPELGLSIAWLGGSALMLLLFRPLFPHHPTILTAPLAVAAGLGIGAAEFPSRRVRVAILLGALAYLSFLPRLAHADRHILLGTAPPSSDPLAVFVRRGSRPTDLVAVDDLRIADGANRLVVPPLCDPSNVRLAAGYLSADDLILAVRRFRPVLVLPRAAYSERPRFIAWLNEHYAKRTAPDGGDAYIRSPR